MKKVIINLFVIFCMVIIPISSFAIKNKTLDKIDMYSGPAGSYVTNEIIGTKTLRNQFIGYNSLTPDWSKTDSYTINASQSFSFSGSVNCSWGSISITPTTMTGVSIRFPADSTRYSRLGAQSDVLIKKKNLKE